MGNKKLVEVNYGIASSYSDFTEINYKLQGELRDKVLAHEAKHSSGPYDKKDFLTDFQSKDPYFFKSLKFALMNPEALVGFFPFMYSYYAKRWTYNSTALYPFIWFGLIFSVFFLVLFGVDFFLCLLGYSIIFIFLNIMLLIITHIRVKKENNFIYKEI